MQKETPTGTMTTCESHLLYRLQNGLPVLGRLQADLLADDVCVLPLHAAPGFGLRLYAQQLVLVPQLHLVLDGG